MATKLVKDSSLTSIADAIRAKCGTLAQLEFPTEFVSAIQDLPTGGGGSSAMPKDVNFYDYDGTVVDAYTASEFAALSAMPSNPTHDGLTAQGWNWTLADAQAYVAKYGRLSIGQMYVTADNDTYIDIVLYDGRLQPSLGIAINGTVNIDWGDGTVVDTVTGTSLTTVKYTQHIYANEGSYTIKLHIVNGSFTIFRAYSTSLGILCKAGASTEASQVYLNAIRAVRIGTNVSLGNYAFSNCHCLNSITLPDHIVNIGEYAFHSCYNLKFISIPNGVTNLNRYLLSSCYNLESLALPNGLVSVPYCFLNYNYKFRDIVIPDSVTSIGNYAFANSRLAKIIIPDNVTSVGENAFYGCVSLSSVTIPDSVTSIGDYAFNSCYGIKKFILKPSTPPTLSGSSVFDNTASDIIIIVPKGCLEAYKTANRWSTQASHMQEAE